MAIKYLDSKRIRGSSTTGATDTLGTGANATNNGAVANAATAIYGKASLSFDGTDDTINFGTTLDAVLAGAFTFTCWAYLTNDSNNKAIICKPHLATWTAPLYHDFTIQHNNSNLEVKTNDGSTYYSFTIDTGDAGWHFISVTKTSGDVWVAQVDNDASDTFTHATDWGSQNLIVGRTPSLAGTFWDGKIQDMSFWSRVLTSGELTTLFNSFDFESATASNNTGKVATSVSQTGLKAYYTFNDATTGVTNSAVVTDEKTTITDVPAGTRYEETDTRKIFRRKLTPTATVFSHLNSSDHAQVNNTNTGEDTRMGQEFQAGHTNIGDSFDKVTIRLRNLFSDSATYAITMKVWNGSTVKATSPTVVTLDDLETSWDSSAPYDDEVVFYFTTPVTIAAGDIIGVEPQGGTVNVNSIGFRYQTSGSVSNTRVNSWRNGAWGGNVGLYNNDAYMILELQESESWVEKGTA